VEDFFQYYKLLKVRDVKDTSQLNEILVNAVKSSRKKKYHGQECDSNMPNPIDQSEARSQMLIAQYAHIKVEKEELKVEMSESSDVEGGN